MHVIKYNKQVIFKGEKKRGRNHICELEWWKGHVDGGPVKTIKRTPQTLAFQFLNDMYTHNYQLLNKSSCIIDSSICCFETQSSKQGTFLYTFFLSFSRHQQLQRLLYYPFIPLKAKHYFLFIKRNYRVINEARFPWKKGGWSELNMYQLFVGGKLK